VIDRYAIEAVSVCPVAQHGPRPRLDAERDVSTAAPRHLSQPLERIAREPGVPGARGRLDQLGQGPGRHVVVEGVRRGLPGRFRRFLVAGQAVVQDRGRPVGIDRHAGPAGRGLLDRRDGVGFAPLQRPEPQQRVGHGPASGCRRDAAGLRDERRGTREVTGPHACHAQSGQVDRQLRQCAGVADEPDVPRARRVPPLLVPHGDAGGLGHPAPAQQVLHGQVGERLRGSLQRRNGGGVPAGGEQSQPVEQQVKRTYRARPRRERPGGAADLAEHVASLDGPDQNPRAPGDQVGLTCELGIERLELPRRVQQQASGGIAPAT
jgi:hypothetical protein